MLTNAEKDFEEDFRDRSDDGYAFMEDVGTTGEDDHSHGGDDSDAHEEDDALLLEPLGSKDLELLFRKRARLVQVALV